MLFLLWAWTSPRNVVGWHNHRKTGRKGDPSRRQEIPDLEETVYHLPGIHSHGENIGGRRNRKLPNKIHDPGRKSPDMHREDKTDPICLRDLGVSVSTHNRKQRGVLELLSYQAGDPERVTRAGIEVKDALHECPPKELGIVLSRPRPSGSLSIHNLDRCIFQGAQGWLSRRGRGITEGRLGI